MKNTISFLKMLGICVLTFTTVAMSCDDDPIQFVINDDFESEINISGSMGQSSFSQSGTLDISNLIDEAGEVFVNFTIVSVEATLENYDDGGNNTLSGNMACNVTSPLTAQLFVTQSLTNNVATNVSLANIDFNSYINELTNNPSIAYSVAGTTSSPIADDNFSIKLKFELQGTIQVN